MTLSHGCKKVRLHVHECVGIFVKLTRKAVLRSSICKLVCSTGVCLKKKYSHDSGHRFISFLNVFGVFSGLPL